MLQHQVEKSVFYLYRKFSYAAEHRRARLKREGCLLELPWSLPKITQGLCASQVIFDGSFWSLPSCTLRRLYWSLCCWICDTCCVTVAWSCSFWDVKVLTRCFNSSSSWSCEEKKKALGVITLLNTILSGRQIKTDKQTVAPALHTTG